MPHDVDFWEAVQRIRSKDSRFAPELYSFVMETLDYTIQRMGERRHVSAVELLEGLCRYARVKFGLMASTVLERWGVDTPSDVGAVVYQLVDAGILSKQESDLLQDFDVSYNFKDTLERGYFD